MDIFVNLLSSLTKLFGGNLGFTIIFVGVISRIVFYPFLKSSLKQPKVLKELKQKLDAVKKKYPNDRSKQASEQARIYREAGFNPAASCISPLIQLVLAIILFNALSKLIHSGIETNFLWLDLVKADTFRLKAIPFALPGVLVILTAVATLVQSK